VTSSAENDTTEWYRNYYRTKGSTRNDPLSNPEVVFQQFGIDESVLHALRSTDLDRARAIVLDVGCGAGGSLSRFLNLGFPPDHLHGIDILPDRIAEARRLWPNVHFDFGDATSMRYPPESFDLVMESTMFVQLTDEELSETIGREMLRVAKPHGYVMLIDWRYGKPWDHHYLGLSRSRIRKIFQVGVLTDFCTSRNGALLPPLGRPLSRYAPAAYFLVRALFPVLVGTKTTVLRKKGPIPDRPFSLVTR